jgi:hypothetical protein
MATYFDKCSRVLVLSQQLIMEVPLSRMELLGSLFYMNV